MIYKCTICGYEYDESKEGVLFADLPDDWQCLWCKAPKSAFEPVGEEPPKEISSSESAEPHEPTTYDIDESMQQLSIGQMAALCSNLARGCEKQYMPKESALFNELAEWFTRHATIVNDATVEEIAAQLQQDIKDYSEVNKVCAQQGDRGAQRVLGWSEKATRMLNSIIGRYQKEGDTLLSNTEIWVCTVCGFVYIGDAAPELCPVCKVPSWKFNKIERRKRS